MACPGAGTCHTRLSRSQACNAAYAVMLRDQKRTERVFVPMISFVWGAALLEQREAGTEMDCETSSTFRLNPPESKAEEVDYPRVGEQTGLDSDGGWSPPSASFGTGRQKPTPPGPPAGGHADRAAASAPGTQLGLGRGRQPRGRALPVLLLSRAAFLSLFSQSTASTEC